MVVNHTDHADAKQTKQKELWILGSNPGSDNVLKALVRQASS